MTRKTQHDITDAEIRAAREFLLGRSDELVPPPRRSAAEARKLRPDVPFHNGIVRARRRQVTRNSA